MRGPSDARHDAGDLDRANHLPRYLSDLAIAELAQGAVETSALTVKLRWVSAEVGSQHLLQSITQHGLSSREFHCVVIEAHEVIRQVACVLTIRIADHYGFYYHEGSNHL